MLKVLLKKQLSEIFRSYYYDAKKNKARAKGTTALYMVLFVFLMVGVIGGMFTLLSLAICGPLAEAGMSWLYFALMGLLAVLLGVFGSVFNTYSGLYLARDNDLLLSMPIPVNVLITARILGVYIMGVMYSGVIMLPAIFVYFIFISAAPAVLLSSLLLFLDITVFILTLSCALGYVVAKVSLKIKNKSFIVVLISLVFFGLYYFFYFKAQEMISDLIANAALYGNKIKGAAYPVYLFGKAGTGDLLAVLIVTLFVAVLFLLMWARMSGTFIKVATASGKSEKKQYKKSDIKKGSQNTALLKKEFLRFTKSPSYMLNNGLGILFFLICGGALLIKQREINAALSAIFGNNNDLAAALFVAAIGLMAAVITVAAPSVSLEGKNLWVLQSLPIRPQQVLFAKFSVQLILSAVPALFCLLCGLQAFRFSAVQILVVFAVSFLYLVFWALLQMFFGLKFVNLGWTNELTPIKQGAAVGLSTLLGFVCPLLLGGGAVVFGKWIGYVGCMAVFGAILLALSWILYRYVFIKGTETLSRL